MIIDLINATNDISLKTGVCIVGAGAAGVALARKLMLAGHDICLLEAGGMDFEQKTQSLYAGENIGMEYYDLDHSRLRFFGGTTNIWGGRNIALDAIDFKKRDWVPHSGWPITLQDLNKYYRIAHDSLELGEFNYSNALWNSLPLDPVQFDPDKIDTRFWRFDTLAERFNNRRCEDLIDSQDVKIVLHANVVGLNATENANRVNSLRAESLHGNKLQVKADHFVLACGAIENARLLLISDDVEANGIGNGHDLVGRYFMEHPHGRVARVEIDDPAAFWSLYRKQFPVNDTPIAPAFVMAEKQQQKLGALNSAVTFKLQRDPGKGVSLNKKIYLNVKHAMSPTRSGRRLWHTWRSTRAFLQRRLALPVLRTAVKLNKLGLYIMARAEQAPNPQSRICLSNDRDALGCPVANLDWQLSGQDKHTMVQFGHTLDEEFKRLGLGSVINYDWLENGKADWPVDASVGNHPIGGYHHMGTTRMSDSPSSGVVDANCTVHGYKNLHIAGSSVFPTGGWANPTLTILAMTHRLGDYLENELAR